MKHSQVRDLHAVHQFGMQAVALEPSEIKIVLCKYMASGGEAARAVELCAAWVKGLGLTYAYGGVKISSGVLRRIALSVVLGGVGFRLLAPISARYTKSPSIHLPDYLEVHG